MNWQDRRNPQAGGAEAHLHEVFGRLARRGHDVTLLVSGWGDAPRRTTLDGMDVHRVGGRHSFALAAPLYYRARLESRGVDLVVEDLNKIPLYSPLWSTAPVVLLIHHLFGTTAFREAALPVAVATWLSERPLAHVYRGVPTQAVSASTAEDLERRGFEADRLTVIPNGVDLDFYSPAPGGEDERAAGPALLYLGRLKRYKRIDLILRALARLRADGVDATLTIAGTGDRARELRALRAELKLEPHVRMPGFVSRERKRELFRQAKVHVLTSPKEGWGITNLEAAACGAPTVASDSPGLRDSVIDGETGRLVPHGDVAALAGALRELITDEELRRRYGRAAREFAERFGWERTARRTEAHLEAHLRSTRETEGPGPRPARRRP